MDDNASVILLTASNVIAIEFTRIPMVALNATSIKFTTIPIMLVLIILLCLSMPLLYFLNNIIIINNWE